MIRRKLVNLVAALSLLLWAAAVVLWVRSAFVGEIVHLPAGGVVDATPSAPMVGPTLNWVRQWSVHSGAGRLQLVRRELQDTSASPPGRVAAPAGAATTDLAAMTGSDVSYGAAGFGYFRRDKQPYSRPPVRGWYWGFLIISVPWWAVVLVTAAGPAAWATSFLRRRRRRLRELARLCPSCGYDLRASPGRCPECGMVVPDERETNPFTVAPAAPVHKA